MANAAITATTWLGINDDATLGSNWSFGVPTSLTDTFIGATPTTSLVGFGAIRANSTLVATSVNFIANDTITIDTKTYIYKASGSADGEVDLGGDIEASLDNLFDAINLVAGGNYGASMTIHPTVSATASTSLTLLVHAKDAGTAGNSIVTTEDGGNTGDAAWDGATLTSGAANGVVIKYVYIDAN